MCYDCGCGLPNDAMGKGHAGAEPNGKSITNKTFEEAAKVEGISPETAKRNAYELLRRELNIKD